MKLRCEPGSFRDPSGHIYHCAGRVFRTVQPRALADYRFIRDGGLLDRLVESGQLVGCREVPPEECPALGLPHQGEALLLEHPVLSFISYPYEWTFSALKAAALLHLDLHLTALEAGATLSDASAYNVQFQGPRPVFIDLLSLRRYREGEPWRGHRQFVEQFLAPLLICASGRMVANAWYRGAVEGLPMTVAADLLPLGWKLRPAVLAHLWLPARMQKRAERAGTRAAARGPVRLPLRSYRAMLIQLRDLVSCLAPANKTTLWGNYPESHTYSAAEQEARRRFVAETVAAARPETVWDLGCNTGDFSAIALAAGAQRAIGFDADVQALERAFHRARNERLELLPLYMDLMNPSPDQGWGSAERASLMRRGGADMVLAMAVVHHIAIGRNVPLPMALDWLTSLAPRGVIEFVPKDDPTVRIMLALRDESVFDGYDEESFATALRSRARIVRREQSSRHGRVLYAYERDGLA